MRRKTVLHFDDEPAFRQTFKLLLTQNGMHVQSCRDQEQAAAFMPMKDYQALVTDSAGLVFGADVKRKHADLSLIVLSGKPRMAAPMADSWLDKSRGWLPALIALLNDSALEEIRDASESTADVLSTLSPETIELYRGKVLVVAGQPEKILGAADTLAEAEQIARKSDYSAAQCRFVQGPARARLTLAELENSAST